MSDSCNGCESNSCGSCESGSCGERKQSFIEKTHEMNNIKKVIGIVSGKGGVGKSLVTSMLAVQMRRKGYNVGILDADITGPSIPKVFGITKKAQGNEYGILPQRTHNDIGIMSVNLLLDKDDAPVIWRGPIIGGTVKQFWTDVIWGDVDYLFLDMPPGTGDVALTVFQSIPLDGIVIVTSPQELVSLIVKKAYNMAKMMNIPILGIVENMSYLKCPDCGKEIKLFGESRIDETAAELGLKVLDKLPIDPEVAQLCDKGEIERMTGDYLSETVSFIEKRLPASDDGIVRIAIPTEGENVCSHFGKCGTFTVVEIENNTVKSKTSLDTTGNQHSLLPGFLAEHGVNMVIAGGMGEGALQGLMNNGIDAITGVSGSIDEAISAYLNGELESSDACCPGHDHEHEGGGCSCGKH